MRFAIDACVPAQLGDALRSLGADVVSGEGRPAMPDDEVLAGAFARDRVLITTDTDFGELVFRDGDWRRVDPVSNCLRGARDRHGSAHRCVRERRTRLVHRAGARLNACASMPD